MYKLGPVPQVRGKKQLDISVASLFVYPFLHDKHNAIPQVIPTHVWATPTSVEHRGEMGEKATDLGFSGGGQTGVGRDF